jgi:hypothetical protein
MGAIIGAGRLNLDPRNERPGKNKQAVPTATA